jgi:hypothetical protein
MKIGQVFADFVESLFAPLFPPLPDSPLPEPEPVPPTPHHQTDRALKKVLSDIKDVQAEQVEQMLALYGEVVSGVPEDDMEDWL